ncbi:hypothetical protein [Streptomyces sp. NPDC047999]|uniref:hypothetical protein n=1 Tax=Streptomyces sp. NPDC047999 TaxID=3365497 RepID=UPI0037200174
MEQNSTEQHDGPVLFPLGGDFLPVAGIESLVLDGRRYYFGFDYKSDMVLSVLFDDPAAMAAYASTYLSLTTGRQGASFWAQEAARSEEASGLCEDGDREFTTEAIRGGQLTRGRERHLRYLLYALDHARHFIATDPPLPGTWSLLLEAAADLPDDPED